MKTVSIVDYGAGNLHSVQKALEHLGHAVRVLTRGEDLVGAGQVVLPGVGAFGDGMRELASRGFPEAIREHVAKGNPLLGICLGMQFLLSRSEEFGEHDGLDIIPGDVRPVVPRSGLKVPHTGWNRIVAPPGRTFEGTHLAGVPSGSFMYFVHSFHAVTRDPAATIAVAAYGATPVTAAIEHGNVFGCQFHPEKSGKVGLALLERFVAD